MAIKGVSITTANRDMLAARFMVVADDYDDVLPLGYWLVTDFGNDDNFEILTTEKFSATYTAVDPIKNGFYDLLENDL
jgi:hypothetical protein